MMKHNEHGGAKMKNKKKLMGVVSFFAMLMSLSFSSQAANTGSDAAFAKDIQNDFKAVNARVLPLRERARHEDKKAVRNQILNTKSVKDTSVKMADPQQEYQSFDIETYTHLPLCVKSNTVDAVSVFSLPPNAGNSCIADFELTGDGGLCWQVCSEDCNGSGACWLSCTYHCTTQGGEGDPRKHG